MGFFNRQMVVTVHFSPKGNEITIAVTVKI